MLIRYLCSFLFPIEIFNYEDQSLCWYRFGKRHHLTEPAMRRLTSTSCIRIWFRWGKLERNGENGEEPAYEYEDSNGIVKKWFYNNELHSPEHHGTIHPSVVTTDKDPKFCRLEWHKNGHRHRNNGQPALISVDKIEYWVDGLLHREDGPAIEFLSGAVQYWEHGIMKAQYSYHPNYPKHTQYERAQALLRGEKIEPSPFTLRD